MAYDGNFLLAFSNNSILSGSQSNDLLIYTGNSNQKILIGCSNNSNIFVTFNSNGFVGVGNSNPQAQLHVTSNLRVDGGINTTGIMNRIWDYSGTISSYGGLKPGPISESARNGSNIIVSTFTPFSNINTEGSIYFPGITGNYITISQPIVSAVNDMTVETWIYLPVSPSNINGLNEPILFGNQSAINQSNNWSLGVNSSNYLSFYATSSNYIAAPLTPISNSNWYHIAICYSNVGKSIQMFINGSNQVLSTWGNNLSGSNTTVATLSTGLSNGSNAPIVLAQNANTALNAYIADFRVVNTVLYTSSFTPPINPLQTYSNTTSLLLKAPFYNPIINTNNIQSYDSLRVHCLPTDALIYGDCYGTNLANLAASNSPLFDSNVTQSIVFNRNLNNYLSFSPRTFNVASKGLTMLTKIMFTSNIEAYERLYEFGNQSGYGSNSILLARTAGSNLLFYIYNGQNTVAFTPTFSFNQNIIYTIICRYDPYNNNDQVNYFGNMAMYVNGSNIGSSNIGSSIGNDRLLNYIFVGNSYSESNYYLNANIYNFAVYNRALTDKEIIDSSAVLNINPLLTNSSIVEIGNSSGKPALVLKNDGSIQVAGSITSTNDQSYYALDYGACNFSISGSTYSNVPNVALNPFNSVGINEGSLYFDGVSGAYININNPICDFSPGIVLTTIEYWINYKSFVFPATIGHMNSAGNLDWAFTVNSSGQLNFITGVSTAPSLLASQPLSLNTWYHVCFTSDGTNYRIFANGVLLQYAAYSGSYTITPNIGIQIGRYYTSYGNFYITNLRIVTGAAVYSTSSTTIGAQIFAPPTGPLSASLTGTTVLLLRVLQNSGRIIMPKIGGTTQVQAYPPIPLSNNLTNVQNTSYGAGYYIMTYSSGGPIFNAFSSGGYYQPIIHSYSLTTPATYIGSNVTVDIYGNQYPGEWLQLQTPNSIILSSYSLSGGSYSLNGTGSAASTPYTFFLMGSRDGINWINLNSTYSNSITTLITQNIQTSYAYNYFRTIINSGITNDGYGDSPCLGCLKFYGIQESINTTNDGQVGLGITRPIQQLEVSGNAIFYGNISANNMGMFRNRILNGSMIVNQRSLYSLNTGSSSFLMDRWQLQMSLSSGSITLCNMSLSNTDTPFQYGFQNSFRMTSATSCSINYIEPQQNLEGYSITDFNWGTNFGIPVNLSFWLRTSMYSSNINVCIQTNGSSNAYVTTVYTVGSNVWQFASFQIPPPPVGTIWNANTSNLGLSLRIGGYQSGNLTSNLNVWQTGNLVGATTSTNIFSAANNFIEFTGVQLEKGTFATPFEFRPYGVELQLCQRYFVGYTAGNNLFIGNWLNYGSIIDGANYSGLYITLPQPMRSVPSLYTSANLTYLVAELSIGSGSFHNGMTINNLSSQSSQTFVVLNSTTQSTESTEGTVSFCRLPAGTLGFSADI